MNGISTTNSTPMLQNCMHAYSNLPSFLQCSYIHGSNWKYIPNFQTLQSVSQFQSAWPNRCPKIPLRPNSSSHNQRTTCSYQREIFGTKYRFGGVLLELVRGCKICPSLIMQGPLLLITIPFGGRELIRMFSP